SALSTASRRYGDAPSVGTTTVTLLAAGGIVVELEHTARHRFLAEPLGDAAPTGLAHPCGRLRMVDEPRERVRERRRVARRDERAGHAVDDELRRAADRRRDHRLGLLHRLED